MTFLIFNSVPSPVLHWTVFLSFSLLVMLCAESPLRFFYLSQNRQPFTETRATIRFCSVALIESTVLRQGRTNTGTVNITVFCHVISYI